MPPDISALWATPVPDDFHARFSARRRRYRYVIYNHSARPGILRNAVKWSHQTLDVGLMADAAMYLIGEHDFSAFRGANCQSKSPVRTVYGCSIIRYQDMIVFDIEANAFLMHMVRNIVGTLLYIGSGRNPVSWMPAVLASRDRREAGPSASPGGLYLVDVHYDDIELPKLPLGPFFLHGAYT
jgi:tRNA pseudouridine38-40 synthase